MKYLEESTRPWGNYQKLYKDETIWVKRVNVNPKGRLSLQKHRHRSETWIITEEIGKALSLLTKRRSLLKKARSLIFPWARCTVSGTLEKNLWSS